MDRLEYYKLDIDTLRRSNDYNLMKSSNLFLNSAVYRRAALEIDEIRSLMVSVRQNAEKLLAICQSQEMYTPWQKVAHSKGKKRQALDRQSGDSKRTRQDLIN